MPEMLVRYWKCNSLSMRLLMWRGDCYFISFLHFPAYIKAAAALCVVCLITDIAATILTGLGLRSQDNRDKHKYYRFAVFCMGFACKTDYLQ